MAVPTDNAYVTWQVPVGVTDALHVLDSAGNLLASISGTGSVVTPSLTPSITIGSATPPTTRLTDSEITFSASSVAVSGGGSIVAVRGGTTIPVGTTVTAGFLYGVQGKLVVQGTLDTTDSWQTGVLGQLDLSVGTLTSQNLSAGWFDCGASAHTTGHVVGLNALLVTNSTAAQADSMEQLNGNAVYGQSFYDQGSGWAQQSTVPTTLTGRLKVLVNGVAMYIPLYV